MAQDTKYLLVNNLIDVATLSTLPSTLVKVYDTLVPEGTKLGELSYSILGEDLTSMPTLDYLNVPRERCARVRQNLAA
ncbi:unnamed protein product [Phytophthora fragariaefolia]|uniref:Unnamed protein product n=1 Tax=Phytophthora fragariaefolia TaxID=1490495 RepID=A0A9W6XIC3_9STRA|nr:unnamed protein product [Phytophthora fragariaefolia]